MRQRRQQMKISKRCHKRARKRCIKKGISKRFLGSCIIDVCAKLGTKGLRRGRRHFKQDE